MRTLHRRSLAGLAAAALAASLVLLVGCPNPVTQLTVSQMKDKAAPAVNIFSPVNNTPYTQTVLVQGTVADSGQLRSVTYTVTGTLGVLATGDVPLSSIGAGGAFSFQFGTIALSGPIAVTISARDWNDNVGSALIMLTSPGTAISSFVATPDNKKVTLDWEEIPDASYTIYYTTSGTLPTESYYVGMIPTTVPHYELTGLKNGALHVFLLKAVTPAGTFWSGYVQCIPLSEFTLAPVVTGGYRKIDLEWNSIEGVNQFEVYRSTDPHGTFVNHTGVITGNSFTDPDIPDNTWYYYKVRPALAGSPLSTFNGAQTVLVPASEQERIVSLATSGLPKKVKTAGSYAFVAAQAAGLLIVDISNPRMPFVAANVPTTNALDVDLYSNRAYVADGSSGLRVIDITTPAAPILLGTFSFGAGTNATGVSFTGGAYAFVLDSSGTTSLRIVNVTNPASMTLVGSHSISGYQLLDVATFNATTYYLIYLPTRKTADPDMNSGTLFETFINAGTSVVNPLASYTYPNASNPSTHFRPVQIVINGPYVYAAATISAFLEEPSQKLLVLSRYPSSLALVGQTPELYGYSCNDIAVSGTKAYAANGKGIQVYDVTTPATPAVGDYWNTPGASEGVAVNGAFGLVASGALGFQLVNVVQPYTPTLQGSWPASAGQQYGGVAVRAGLAFVTSSSPGRLRILNVQSPPTITETAAFPQGSPAAVALSGDYVFVGNGTASDGLSIVNISTPSAPVQRGVVPLIYGSSKAISVKGDYAYIAAGNGLQVFDVSNPDLPEAIGFFEAESSVNGVALRGNYAYVADGAMFRANSLKVVDVSNPALPALVGRSDFGVTVTGVSLHGDYAFVTDGYPDAGLYAVNINSSSGSFLANYGPCGTNPAGFGYSEGLVASGQRAYVADNSTAAGLAVVDILDPKALANSKRLTNVTWTNGTANQVALSGRYLYVTDTNIGSSNVGMKIIRLF